MFLISDDSWEVQQTKEKGLGVFCKKIIPTGTVISDYLGTIIETAKYDLELDKEGLYLMYYSDQVSLYPDLAKSGPHLINHSCTPNCWMYIYCGHTLFFALRTIEPGEELTISYLLDPDEGSCKQCNHVCKCGSNKCTGTMHLSRSNYEKWQRFQKEENKKTKKKSVVIGKVLSRLPLYPLKISINPIYREIIKI